MALTDHCPAIGADEVRPAGRLTTLLVVRGLDVEPPVVGTRTAVGSILLAHNALLVIGNFIVLALPRLACSGSESRQVGAEPCDDPWQ
jgi:hypothetical protein